MLTALAQQADVELGQELGVDDYVTKPFDPDEVLKSIRRVLERQSPRDAK
jgi:DNA-binding response OmpR family regulator